MEKGKERRITELLSAFLLICVIGFSTADTSEAASYTLKLRQLCTDYPNASAYFEIKDADGNIVKPTGNVALNISDKSIKADGVKQFSREDEGIAVVFLIDVSSSMSQKRFAELKNALSVQIKKLSPKDQAAVVSVGNEVTVCQDYTSETKTLLYTVQQLKAKASQTCLNSGVISALELAGIQNASLPKRRMIVLATDGMDDSTSSATIGEVREAIDEKHIPVYTLFCDSENKSSSRQKDSDAVGEYARRSGGTFVDVKSKSIDDTLDAIFNDAAKTSIAEFNISDAAADGQKARATLVYSDGSINLSEGIDVRLVKSGHDNPYASSGDASSGDTSNGGVISGDGSDNGGIGNITKNKAVLFGSIAIVAIALIGAVLLVLKNNKKKHKLKRNGSDEHPFFADNTPATQRFSPSADNGTTQRIQPQNATTGIFGGQKCKPVKNGPMIDLELSVTGSRGSTETYNLSVNNRLVLGRKGGTGADFVFPGDSTISARHCELVFSNGSLSVVDLNSTNGTYVNGVPIKGTYQLNDGDRLMLGKTEFKVRITGVR